MGKAKYKSIRKANKTTSRVPNYVPYPALAKYINEINIGTVIDVQEQFGDSQPVDGMCRPISEYALRLAKFYLTVNEKRNDKLVNFAGKKNPQSMLFIMAIGGDGAPGSGTSILVSFLNVSLRIASSAENFLLFGANVPENSNVVRKFILQLISDIKYLESNVFQVHANDGNHSLTLKDLKMLRSH